MSFLGGLLGSGGNVTTQSNPITQQTTTDSGNTQTASGNTQAGSANTVGGSLAMDSNNSESSVSIAPQLGAGSQLTIALDSNNRGAAQSAANLGAASQQDDGFGFGGSVGPSAGPGISADAVPTAAAGSLGGLSTTTILVLVAAGIIGIIAMSRG